MRDGLVTVTLAASEATITEVVLREIERAMASDELDGDTRARLYPRAYLDPTEEEAEQEWQGLVHDDLARARAEAFRAVLADLTTDAEDDAVVIKLDDERQTQWVSVLNDARLVIGTAIDVTEDDEIDYAPDDPRYAWGELYHWITYLQGELVDVLLDALPDLPE
jgi:hypothetical protein